MKVDVCVLLGIKAKCTKCFTILPQSQIHTLMLKDTVSRGSHPHPLDYRTATQPVYIMNTNWSSSKEDVDMLHPARVRHEVALLL